MSVYKPDRDYKVLYGVPTYSQFDDCRRAVERIINTSTLVPDTIVIIDNSETGAVFYALGDLTEKYADVRIYQRDENILAGAWNDIMRMSADYTIIANDDVFPHAGSIEALVNAARSNPEVAMWNGSGHSGNSYSFYLLQHWAYKLVGPFDEAFIPAYFEDNDYDWRIKCAGLIREEVPEATFDHIGSATMKNMNDARVVHHHKRFKENRRYFITKWGGEPGKEKFKIPRERLVYVDISDL